MGPTAKYNLQSHKLYLAISLPVSNDDKSTKYLKTFYKNYTALFLFFDSLSSAQWKITFFSPHYFLKSNHEPILFFLRVVFFCFLL